VALTPSRSRRAGTLAAPVLALAAALSLSGCDATGAADGAADPTPSASAPSTATEGPVREDLLVQGFDVCSVLTPPQVRRATGQVGEPSTRALSRVPGYAGITDQCGFGVSFDSYTITVDVGMQPATRRTVTRLPVKPARDVDASGIGTVARATDSGRFSAVYFVKGRTFVRVQAFRSDGASKLRGVVSAARAVAAKVPANPPVSDEETSGACARLDAEAVAGVLGSEPGLSRSFPYRDNSSVCSFASGVGPDARFLAVSTYTNISAGPFFAEQEHFLPSKQVLGVSSGKAFTVPGTAYFIGDDGQAIGVTGSLGGDPKVPARPTQPLVDLLNSASALLH
jgi:hypothetical protein